MRYCVVMEWQQLAYPCTPWVLRWGSEVPCLRTLPQFKKKKPARLEHGTAWLRVIHYYLQLC